MNAHATNLEYDVILAMLNDQALSAHAKSLALSLEPILNEDILHNALRETTDARQLIEEQGLPPLAIMAGLEDDVRLTAQGGQLTPDQLTGVAMFANTCRRMASYLKRGEETRVELSLNGRAFIALSSLQDEIENAVRGGEVMDSASSELRAIRRKITVAEERVKSRLNAILQSHKEWFADAYVAERGGRLTLPVKAQYKAMVPGALIDRSQTGGTLFIEPASVRAAQEEAYALRIDEENEVRRILYALSSLVADESEAIFANMRLMQTLDFIFAKGKLSLEMRAFPVPATRSRVLRIVKGRHPLLDPEKNVPLDFSMGGDLRGVIITGPNTGGKTVALKTIGLLSMMAQSGLHIPADETSAIPMSDAVLSDIGDGQSIAENLSTFSAHMTQVLMILKRATRESLVLLDELGSGTDPAEGMGLAVAVLEELSARGCLFVATTHYPEIKEFARRAPGMTNARMSFDADTLEPLYQLILGEAGESCALHIARRLGFSEQLLDRASRAAYQGVLDMERTGAPIEKIAGAKLTSFEKPKQAPERALSFSRGDCVRVYPEGMMGIVYQTSDERGMIGVQLRGQKRMVAYKRLKQIAPAEAMYPEDYDFSIIFDSVANRKARHVMGKRHDPNAVIKEE